MASPRKKYQTLIELAPDPIFLIDLTSGAIGEVNRAAAELLEYSVAALEGKPVAEIHPADATRAYLEAFRETVEAGELRLDSLPDGRDLFLVTKSGRHVPVEIHAKTLELEGAPWIFSIARDISEQRERERELRRQNDRLRTVAEILSHDLRNPLNVAAGRVDQVRDEIDSDRLETAADALDRMDELVDNTLAMTRQGQAVDDPQPVDIGDLLAECWTMVQTDEATLEIDVAGTMEADPSRLRQLFENLFRNAVEHGGGDVTIRIGRVNDGIFVADDGPGVPTDASGSLFEPGYSSADDGTGFGLAIVESIVAAHGWEITVGESEHGGARFEITGLGLDS